MRFGNINLEHGIILAPMAGVTDRAFRQICREQGAEMVISEMISAKGIYYSDRKTAELAAISPDERPSVLQIFGNDPEIMAYAADSLIKYNPDGIDINMGCPVPKVAGNGDGSALMKTPELAGRIVRAVADVMSKYNLKVSVKIRAGWNSSAINAPEIAKIAQDNGAAAVTVHGRTREMMYSGKADLDVIKAVKNAVDIPVIGNGDINSTDNAKKMIEYTGCDGIMIGRGALGNPWLFGQIRAALDGASAIEQSEPEQWKSVLARHLKLAVEDKGEHRAVHEMRKHIGWYIKGVPQAAQLRNQACSAETLEQMMEIVERAYR